jgi:hypothetical protein
MTFANVIAFGVNGVDAAAAAAAAEPCFPRPAAATVAALVVVVTFLTKCLRHSASARS